MQITQINFAEDSTDRVDVRFTQEGTERSGNWAWPLRDEGKAEAVAAFLAAQEPPLTEPLPLPEPEPTSGEVNAERDRRIDAGIMFNGVEFQTRSEDRENIQGAYALAQTAIPVNGAQPGDLRWHGETSDFEWIAADDSRVTMDAQTVLLFGQAVLAHKSAHIFAANAIKSMDPIPADYAANATYWPTPAS